MNELLYRLKNAYLSLRGEIGSKTVTKLLDRCQILRSEIVLWKQSFEEQKKRADLAAKLYNESEAGRKTASDLTGQKVIEQMGQNPKAFLPPNEL